MRRGFAARPCLPSLDRLAATMLSRSSVPSNGVLLQAGLRRPIENTVLLPSPPNGLRALKRM